MAVLMPMRAPAAVPAAARRVPGVDGRVRLDDPVDGPSRVPGLDLAPQPADHAGGQRVVKPERVPDGVHALADHQVGGRFRLARVRASAPVRFVVIAGERFAGVPYLPMATATGCS